MTKLNNNNNSIIFHKFSFVEIHLIPQVFFSNKNSAKYTYRKFRIPQSTPSPHWTYNLDRGVQIDVIYTDFEKAFDKVPHQGLISKLKACNFNSELLIGFKTSCVIENNGL